MFNRDQHAAMTRPGRDWVFRLATGGLSLCVGLVLLIAVEATLRWMGLGDPVLYHTNSSYRYAPVPNQQKQRRRGAIVTIDSHGLRTVHDWSTQADLRLLFIGDSITWGGTSVDDTQTFAHRCGQEIQEKTGLTVVAGNAGVNAYGTDNMAQRLRYLSFDDEDVIVVTLITSDTTRGLADLRASYFFSRRPPGPFRAIWEATAFAHYKITSQMRLDQDPDQTGDDLQVARDSLSRLFDILRVKRDEGKQVLLVLSPARDELNGEESALTRGVREMLAGSGLDFLDMHEAAADQLDASMYIDHVHLDVPGHALYGRLIAEKLLATRKPASN